MDNNAKREFLKSYRLQRAIICRIQETSQHYPQKAKTYKAQIKECEKRQKAIEDKINQLPNEFQREVLIQKYICGKTHEEIGILFNYSSRQIERIHKAAVENLKM